MLEIAVLRAAMGLVLSAKSARMLRACGLVCWLSAYRPASVTSVCVELSAKSRKAPSTLSSFEEPSKEIALVLTLRLGSFCAPPRIIGVAALPPCRARKTNAARLQAVVWPEFGFNQSVDTA